MADKIDNGLLNATDPNLKEFAACGGKLLLYHGWNDQLIAPRNAVNYFKSVMDTMGPKTADSVRLFMVPGMGHCVGGEGTSTFDTVSVMEEWVEKGKAPAQIVASRMANGKVERTRPLCPTRRSRSIRVAGVPTRRRILCARRYDGVIARHGLRLR